MSVPRLPRFLLSRLLPPADRSIVLGDLDEEFRRHVAPHRSGARAVLWYWRQALVSAPPALRMRWQKRARPTADAARRAGMPAQVLADARFGLRWLRGRPGFTAAAILTLTAGIAFTTASVSVTHAVLLRGLPFPEADRLVHLGELDRDELGTDRESADGNLSWPDFLDYRDSNRTLASMAGYSGGSRTLTGTGIAERVSMAEVTEAFFATLGVTPLLGRDFTPEDGRSGAPAVVILAHGAWQRRFGADPAMIGQSITLNGRSTEVVGVLPATFEFPPRGAAELWLPIRPSTAQVERRFFHWLNAIGRLRPDATADQARADLNAIAAGFATIDPEHHPMAAMALEPLEPFVIGDAGEIVLLLFSAACLVLLIGCTNVAGLLLARSAGRTREMDVRSAMGASRGRLVRQLLTESLVLAAPAAALGVATGEGLVRLFVAALPPAQQAGLPHLQALTVEPLVIGWAVGASGLAAALFGLAPAWRLARRGHRTTLRGVTGHDRRDALLQAGLVVAQVAVAIVLLTGAGLMGRTVAGLLAVSPGFTPDGLLTMRVNLSGPTRQSVVGFHRELLERLAVLPGVTGVSTIDQLPLTGSGNTGTFVIEGLTDAVERETRVRTVAADYHDVMGIPLLAGRSFAPTDRPGTPRVLLVNESFAATYFAGDAVGERIAFPFFEGRPYWEIVGVVGNEQFSALDRAMQPVAYFAYGQEPGGAFSIVLRTAGDPLAQVAPARAVLADLDPNLPFFAERSMREIIDTSDAVFRRRTVMTLIGVFAFVALTLASVGLYGIVAQAVAVRRREIGVRVTLGARPGQIVRVVLRRGLGPAVVGLGIGLVASVLAASGLGGLLFGVAPTDWPTLAGVATLLGVTAVVACLMPARRALRVDPVEALRQE